MLYILDLYLYTRIRVVFFMSWCRGVAGEERRSTLKKKNHNMVGTKKIKHTKGTSAPDPQEKRRPLSPMPVSQLPKLQPRYLLVSTTALAKHVTMCQLGCQTKRSNKNNQNNKNNKILE